MAYYKFGVLSVCSHENTINLEAFWCLGCLIIVIFLESVIYPAEIQANLTVLKLTFF